jgi:hypothetical protein
MLGGHHRSLTDLGFDFRLNALKVTLAPSASTNKPMTASIGECSSEVGVAPEDRFFTSTPLGAWPESANAEGAALFPFESQLHIRAKHQDPGQPLLLTKIRPMDEPSL